MEKLEDGTLSIKCKVSGYKIDILLNDKQATVSSDNSTIDRFVLKALDREIPQFSDLETQLNKQQHPNVGTEIQVS